MANRLQIKIISLIHVNQYGFIKSRTIQDCLAWAYEYIYQCLHSKKEIVIKLTLEKPLIQLSTMWSFKWWNISVLMISGVTGLKEFLLQDSWPFSSMVCQGNRVIHSLLSYSCWQQIYFSASSINWRHNSDHESISDGALHPERFTWILCSINRPES